MRTMVKSFVVGTLGLAVLFGLPGVSLALPKAGGVECNGPLDHLPPGKMCPKDYTETNLHRQDGTCEVHCCRDTPDGKLVCGAPPVDVKLEGPRNVRPNLPATIYEPPPSPPVGPRAPFGTVKPLVAATTSPSVSQIAASVNIPALSSGSVAAECPAGTRVTGGGYGIGSNLILRLVNSSMIGNAWRVVASNASSPNQQLIAYAVCISGLSGTTTQEGKQISIPPGTSGGNTVTCSSGKTVTGGGFSQNNVEVFLTEQNQNGWTTSAKNIGGSSGLLNNYAICYGPATPSTFTVGTQVVVAANGEGQAAAECPQGSLVTGGGFAINNPGYGMVHTMLKIGNAWRAVLKNFPGGTGIGNVLSVYATCMNLSPGPAGARPTVAPGLKQP